MMGKIIGVAILAVIWPIFLVAIAGVIIYKCRHRLQESLTNSV